MDFFRVFLKNPVHEKLDLYAINPSEALKVDPKPDTYFISLPEEAAELPVGVYFFVQVRKQCIEDSELLELAVELQKEALWSRFRPKEKLYLRKLFSVNAHFARSYNVHSCGRIVGDLS